MARLIYSAITSLDGYVEDKDGTFDWAEPDEEVFRFINGLERPIGTYLYGRRMYETMVYWETVHPSTGHASWAEDFAVIWQAAEKVVFSRTLEACSSARTRIEQEFDPTAVRLMKTRGLHDISVGGADLASQAITAGLIDEIQLFLTPTLVGGGKPALPLGVRLDVELLDERRFHSGVVYLRYRQSA